MSNHLDPTYLRYIYDGLVKGSIHPENAAELPEGFIGLYEETFDERTSVVERQKLLERFAIWALLKKEVTAQFVAEVLNQPEQEIQDFISTYSAWFNSPESGKYQLYHERLKVYLLQKLSVLEIKYLNSLIIDKVIHQVGKEFEIYKVEFLVFHLFFNDEFFQAYDFLIDYKTYLDAEKHFQSDIFLQYQLDLCIRKFAQLNHESKILELLKVQYKQLNISLYKVRKNPFFLYNLDNLIDTIEASKMLILDRKKSFWQEVLIEIIQKPEDVANVNEILKRFDNEIECFGIVERNSDEHFKFDGISRKNFFLLLNYLLDNKFETKWLVDRFDWLPNYFLSRDAILDDEEYFSDFKLVQLINKEKILRLLEESLERKTFYDLHRNKVWCLKFISRLSEIRTENNGEKISFFELNKTQSPLQKKERVNYRYSQKYSTSLIPIWLNTENWRNHINIELNDFECIKKILLELRNDDIFANVDLKLMFFDCLYELCSLTEGELADYTIQDEFLDQLLLFFTIIYANIGIKKFISVLEFFSSNFEISIWNEYTGELGPLDLKETILECVIPIIVKYDNTEQNIKFLTESKVINKFEIILCFCDMYKEKSITITNIPEFKVVDLTNYFHNTPEYLFHISFCLKINLNLIFQSLNDANKLNFKNSVFFVFHSFLAPEIINSIEIQMNNKLESKDVFFLEPLLLKVLSEILKSEIVSKELTSRFLDCIVNSNRYFDIEELINGSFNKSLIYMKFSNNFKYSNQLIS